MIKGLCGLPGGGKSTSMAEMALRAQKAGRLVFSNCPMRGCYQLSVEMFAKNQFPAGSLVMVDEANMSFNSRQWRMLDHEAYKMFALHRHYGLDLVFATQHPARLDVSIRELIAVWIECSAVRIPFSDKVLWFEQREYLCEDQVFSGAEPVSFRRFLPKKRIYEAFDTMWLMDQKLREEVVPVPWPWPEREKAPSLFERVKLRVGKKKSCPSIR